jgi:hypothetical protein
MPYFRVSDQNVLFLHVPKCAGSSLTEMVTDLPQCTGHGLYRKGRESLDYEVKKCPPQHFHAAILDAMLELDRFDLVFTVIRDPLKRLLSEHAMCLLRGDSGEQDFNAWYVLARQLRAENSFVWDNHLRPAVDFMLPSARVYTLECGLPWIWEDLCRRLAITTSGYAVKHTRPRQSMPTLEEKVSTETRQLVRQDYAEDYELHRLATEHRGPGPSVPTFAQLQRCSAASLP